LLRAGLSPAAKVLDLKGAAPVPRGREEGAGGGFDQVAGGGRERISWGALIPPDRRRRRGLLGEGAAPGWGNTLDAAPHLDLAGPRLEAPSPALSYSPPVNEVSAPEGELYLPGRKPPISARALRYRLTPKSCPTRAGRLKARPGRASALRPGSAIRRMPARVVDRGSIRRPQRPRNRGTRSSRRLPTPRR
jgi:hypothetical protein